MIPISECKDGWLYQVPCRNAFFGVYNEKTQDFTIARYKFGEWYLFEEIHWDACSTFGTARPMEEICFLGDMNSDDLLQLLFDLGSGEDTILS